MGNPQRRLSFRPSLYPEGRYLGRDPTLPLGALLPCSSFWSEGWSDADSVCAMKNMEGRRWPVISIALVLLNVGIFPRH